MLIYRSMPDGTFLAGDTATGGAQIAHASSFWAKRAMRQPEHAARSLLHHSCLPNPSTQRGRSAARRNAAIIKNLLEIARSQADTACKHAVHFVDDEDARHDA